MFIGDLRQRRTVVDVTQALRRLAAAVVRTRWYRTSRPAELSGPASSNPTNTMARLKGKSPAERGHVMANTTKIVVARVYPKPGRLQEVIDVYASIAPLVHQEPGGETDSSSWGYVTSTSRSHRRGPGAELNPGGRWSQVTIDLAEQVHRMLYG